MRANDSAFPFAAGWDDPSSPADELGLSKRELFLLGAMVAVYSRPDLGHLALVERSMLALKIADAMIEVVNLRKPPRQEVDE
jgi:hypothetical protein